MVYDDLDLYVGVCIAWKHMWVVYMIYDMA